MALTAARQQATTALLDASEHLLVEVGYAKITVRALADQAQVNQGLVHYYFGSMEEVLLQTLERFTRRLIERQRALYEGPEPFVDKWRTAMRYLVEDHESGYQKVWLELQAMAWNHPHLRERVAEVLTAWVAVLRPAFASGLQELGVTVPADVVVALVATFNQGIILEQLSGADSGHRQLLGWIDDWITERTRSADAGA